MDPITCIFFGRSGSGKGTQAKLLVEYLEKNTDKKVLYIETGEKFREFKNDNNLTSKLTKEIMEHGGLIPGFLPIWIWTDHLIKNYTGNEHLVLDGLSRRRNEAPILHNALKFYGLNKPFVIHLNVSREKAFGFMKSRGRNDDTDLYINSRLDWFDEEVLPSIEYFKEQSDVIFLDIYGEDNIEEVHKKIIASIFKP